MQVPKDANEERKPCLICSRHDLFKTHITMLVSVSHSMSISRARSVTYTELSPVIEYVAPAPADTHAARYPAIEYVAPTSVVTYAAPSSEIDNVAPAPVVFHAAPATVVERSAMLEIGHEHEHIWKRRKKDPMMRCTFEISCLSFLCSKLPDPRITSNFQNYHYHSVSNLISPVMFCL